jgi:hypothetical protein
LYMRKMAPPVRIEAIPLPPLDLSRLTKPVVVAVVVGFFIGVPPAMMALGAAVLLITRMIEPREPVGVKKGASSTDQVLMGITMYR